MTCFAQFISLNQKLTRCNCGFTYLSCLKETAFPELYFFFIIIFNWNKENKHQVNVIHVYLRTAQSFRV